MGIKPVVKDTIDKERMRQQKKCAGTKKDLIFGAKSVNLMGGVFVPIWDFAFYKNTNLFGGRDFGFQQPALFVPISSHHLFDLLSGSVPIQEHGAVFGQPFLLYLGRTEVFPSDVDFDWGQLCCGTFDGAL